MVILLLLLGGGGGAWWYINQNGSKPGGVLASVTAAVSGGTSGGASVVPNSSAGPQALANAKGWNTEGQAKVNAWQFGGMGDETDAINDMAARGDGRIVMVGVLHDRNALPKANKIHNLVDSASGSEYGFVAELSADGSTMNWFSIFGGDIVYPNCVAIGPDGSIAIGGKKRARTKQKSTLPDQQFKGRDSVILKVSADGSRLEWMGEGGPNQAMVNDIQVDDKGRIVWAAGTIARGSAAYIMRKNADGSPSEFPAQPNGRGWAIDFDVRGGQFLEEGQIGAFYELDKASPDGYDYDGPGGWGPTWFKLFGIRQGGYLTLMPNGDIVASGTLQYDFKVKGTRSFPAFDTIVARWTSDGDLIWSTNLYQEGDGVHTPDQKDKDIIYNPVNGDLYVLVGQHGSNVYRFKGKLYGDTGNLFISWIGQVDAETGKLKEGWYWQNSRNTGYSKNGIPQSPPYPKLAGNDAEQLGVDSQGNIYFAGNSGAKAFSTPNAWKPWPQSESGNGNASLTVLSPDLKTIKYATQIMGSEHGKSRAGALVVTSAGVWVGGHNASRDFVNSQAPWSSTTVSGKADAALARFQFD
jgi:hypothetical protein